MEFCEGHEAVRFVDPSPAKPAKAEVAHCTVMHDQLRLIDALSLTAPQPTPSARAFSAAAWTSKPRCTFARGTKARMGPSKTSRVS